VGVGRGGKGIYIISIYLLPIYKGKKKTNVKEMGPKGNYK
jgi:hypothetical protein